MKTPPEAREMLLKYLQPGALILTILRRKTARETVLDVFTWDGRFDNGRGACARLSGYTSTLMDAKYGGASRYSDKHSGVIIRGCQLNADEEVRQFLGVELFNDRNALRYQRL
jgi:hypothetical protein